MTTYEYWRIGLIVGLPVLAFVVQYVYMTVLVFSLKHNIPELYRKVEVLLERVHRLEKARCLAEYVKQLEEQEKRPAA